MQGICVARPLLYLSLKESSFFEVLDSSERRNTMTMIDALVLNGSQYMVSLGLLALAWATSQRDRA